MNLLEKALFKPCYSFLEFSMIIVLATIAFIINDFLVLLFIVPISGIVTYIQYKLEMI